ncbi:unnamed protein product [Rotaria socialis]|uniref:Uncharacterized protein n=1 Tax=Rotaria socialis TaxID=392032 RepID=A0A820QHC1_9BILA|nr:unnamed protein product [Rotaria socialis]CAF3564344.1 unnamed protein product [Rotaria socialis]CAF4235263.1 unnamed protein product [Rotaria socialis]CAF4421580.1 unnamed protein product [Rotaria socialis]
MTTKTTITLSPIKHCYTSPNLKKRRITSISTYRKYQTNLSLTLPHMILSSTAISVCCEQQNISTHNLPDLLNDIFIEQQRRETINTIATILRKVGDQIDDHLRTVNNSSSSSDHRFGQRTIKIINCLSHILRFFL